MEEGRRRPELAEDVSIKREHVNDGSWDRLVLDDATDCGVVAAEVEIIDATDCWLTVARVLGLRRSSTSCSSCVGTFCASVAAHGPAVTTSST